MSQSLHTDESTDDSISVTVLKPYSQTAPVNSSPLLFSVAHSLGESQESPVMEEPLDRQQNSDFGDMPNLLKISSEHESPRITEEKKRPLWWRILVCKLL